MSSYKYSLHRYHAIAKADVIVDGITVLAGENGCGKSTLSRWLYYLVDTSAQFDQYLFDDLKSELYSQIRNLRMVSRDLGRDVYEVISDGLDHLSTSKSNIEDPEEKLLGIYCDIISQFSERLIFFMNEHRSRLSVTRINRFLNLRFEEGDNYNEVVRRFKEEQYRVAESLKKDYLQNIEKRNTSKFFEIIHNRFDVTDTDPEDIQLSEDGLKIIGKRQFSNLYGLRNVIYVDTPMAITNKYTDNFFWNALRNKIITTKNVGQSRGVARLLIRIRKLLGGQVYSKDDTYNIEKELHYVRSADNLDIRLEDAATGIKTFAYIQRLLENGHLNNETLLLIDEPEAHLHPKWIFEFAHILVLLYKELGVKVMVASHNPDMVAAIQKIAMVENVIDHTHFYQASRDEDTLQYYYKDLGGNINEIFRTFNIATSRIQDYGEEFDTQSL